jgi:hypothetical protein
MTAARRRDAVVSSDRGSAGRADVEVEPARLRVGVALALASLAPHPNQTCAYDGYWRVRHGRNLDRSPLPTAAHPLQAPAGRREKGAHGDGARVFYICNAKLRFARSA